MDTPSSADLERALLRELLAAWHRSNDADFGGRMRPPVMALHDTGPLGRYHPGRRHLSLWRAMAWTAPWGQVVEVLRHEMAHQFVHEVLQTQGETAHGPTFRRVCRERGIDARAAGVPTSTDSVEDRVVRKVRGLLALSSSDNPHEAEAAAKAARRLLARHDLDLGDALQRTPYTFAQVGPTKQRFDAWEKALGGLLASHFGVNAIYANAYRATDASWGRVLELLGPAHHVDVAAYVHDVLRETGERLWRTHRKAHGLKGNKERRAYLFGVMVGFDEALQAEVADDETALVHVEEAEAAAYVGSRYPHIQRRTWSGARPSEHLLHGKEAGRRISVRPGVGASDEGPRRIVDKRR